MVWNDESQNGLQDGGEPFFGGVTVKLYNGSNQEIGETTTAADGTYQFLGLVAGTYTVELADSNFGAGAVLEGFFMTLQDVGGNQNGSDLIDSDFVPDTANAVVTVQVVIGSDTEHVDAGLYEIEACVPIGLDIIYLLDTSASMVEPYSGSTSKLDAAKEAIRSTNDLVSGWNNGSRVGLMGYYGANADDDYGLTEAFFNPRVPLTTNYASVNTALDSAVALGSTATALGLRTAASFMAMENNTVNIPVIILLTDGVPTVDFDSLTILETLPGEYLISAQGYVYLDAHVSPIDIRTTPGGPELPGFRSIAEVRTMGVDYSGTYPGTYEWNGQTYTYYSGKAMADAMDAALWAVNGAGMNDLTMHGIFIRGQGATFNDGIVEYVADAGGGIWDSPSNLQALREDRKSVV